MTVGTETKMELVPHYLRASSPDQLTQKMLENNLLERKEIKYFDIQFVSGYWYAWFYKEVAFAPLFSKAKLGKK